MEKRKKIGIRRERRAHMDCRIFIFPPYYYKRISFQIHLWGKNAASNVLTLKGEKSAKNIPLNILLFGD